MHFGSEWQDHEKLLFLKKLINIQTVETTTEEIDICEQQEESEDLKI